MYHLLTRTHINSAVPSYSNDTQCAIDLFAIVLDITCI